MDPCLLCFRSSLSLTHTVLIDFYFTLAYYHQYMLQGRPHLCRYMPRTKDARRIVADPDNEPNFYRISQMYPLHVDNDHADEDKDKNKKEGYPNTTKHNKTSENDQNSQSNLDRTELIGAIKSTHDDKAANRMTPSTALPAATRVTLFPPINSAVPTASTTCATTSANNSSTIRLPPLWQDSNVLSSLLASACATQKPQQEAISSSAFRPNVMPTTSAATTTTTTATTVLAPPPTHDTVPPRFMAALSESLMTTHRRNSYNHGHDMPATWSSLSSTRTLLQAAMSSSSSSSSTMTARNPPPVVVLNAETLALVRLVLAAEQAQQQHMQNWPLSQSKQWG